jgi:carbamoyl-phosphate synthase small subunit
MAQERRAFARQHGGPAVGAAALALEDGRVFRGRAAGARGLAQGEAAFCTAMTGYQEVVTDPSYAGQIVLLTFPLIGNAGANATDAESVTPRARGLIVRRFSRYTTNHRAEETFVDLLHRHGIPAAEDMDTRAITHHLRTRGAMRAALVTDERATGSDRELVALAGAAPGLVGIDLATAVSRAVPERVAADGRTAPVPAGDPFAGGEGPRLLVLDFGVKAGIPHALAARGARVVILPATTPAADILALAPAGVVLANGPGDPAAVAPGIALARALLGRVPLLGICLGHQLLALALGLAIEKLHFGHRGANHPVLDLETGRVLVTSQNHGFTVVPRGGREIEVTHRSLFDSTLEGFRERSLRVRAVQFHPEARPGPHDASPIFDQFLADLAAVPAACSTGAPCPAVVN